MRRFLLLLPVAAMVGLGLASGAGGRVEAQADDAPHPAVGTWLVQRVPPMSEQPTEHLLLAADGTALDIGLLGTTSAGAWAPDGPDGAVVTFTALTNGPAYVVVRARVAVAPDGQTLTGTFTNEMVFDPEHGGTSGEVGPGAITGRRQVVEAPGTPTMSFADFYAPPGATPAATPAP